MVAFVSLKPTLDGFLVESHWAGPVHSVIGSCRRQGCNWSLISPAFTLVRLHLTRG